MGVTHYQLLFASSCMIVLEYNHLKWIWWTYSDCRTCGTKNEECACGRARKIMMLL